MHHILREHFPLLTLHYKICPTVIIQELAVLLHQCYRQFQCVMNKSKNVYFLQTGEF